MWKVTVLSYYETDYIRELYFHNSQDAQDFAGLYDYSCDYFAEVEPPN